MTHNNKNRSGYWFKNLNWLIVLGFLLCTPVLALAADPTFTPLVDIPGITDADADIGEYVNGLYWLSITAASLLVVVKIIGAGAGYVMTDVVTSKEQAKKDIRNALIGLLIILAAVTILNEINPNLKKLNFLEGVDKVEVKGSNVTSLVTDDMWIKVCSKKDCKVEIQTCRGSNGFVDFKIAESTTTNKLTCYRKLNKGTNNPGSSSNDAGPKDYDLSGTYTINDPAIPGTVVEQGPTHGLNVTLIKKNKLGYDVLFPNGTTVPTPCDDLKPTPPGC